MSAIVTLRLLVLILILIEKTGFIHKDDTTVSSLLIVAPIYDSMSDLGEIEVYQRADFQSGSRVLKKVF